MGREKFIHTYNERRIEKKEPKEMIIKFHKNLYKKKAINEAIKAFRGFVEIILTEDTRYFVVDLKNINKDVAGVIKEEFANYTLYLMKK